MRGVAGTTCIRRRDLSEGVRMAWAVGDEGERVPMRAQGGEHDAAAAVILRGMAVAAATQKPLPCATAVLLDKTVQSAKLGQDKAEAVLAQMRADAAKICDKWDAQVATTKEEVAQARRAGVEVAGAETEEALAERVQVARMGSGRGGTACEKGSGGHARLVRGGHHAWLRCLRDMPMLRALDVRHCGGYAWRGWCGCGEADVASDGRGEGCDVLEWYACACPQCATQAVLEGNADAIAWLTQAVRQARAGMQARTQRKRDEWQSVLLELEQEADRQPCV